MPTNTINKLKEVILVAGKPTKHFTLEDLRQSQRDAAKKWYSKPENRQKRLESMKKYNERMKQEKAKKEAE